VQLAAERIKPLVLRRLRLSRVLFRGLRHGVEYLYYAGTMSGLRSSMALDRFAYVATAGRVTSNGMKIKINRLDPWLDQMSKNATDSDKIHRARRQAAFGLILATSIFAIV
jgi:hypothetical protein